MHELIDNRIRKNDTVIQNLFVKQQARPTFTAIPSENAETYANGTSSFGNSFSNGTIYNDYRQPDEPNYNVADGIDDDPEGRKISTIRSLKTGYGFVNFPPNNLFFHYTSLIDTDFNELQVDDEVEFTVSQNAEGKDIAIDVRLLRP
jgi:cold shock CspA family protein